MGRKRTKKQTLNEFRAWLNGVEELQPEDWAPDAAQWKLIREKINNISEPKDTTVDTATLTKLIEELSAPAVPARPGAPLQHPVNPMAAGIPPAPPPPAGVPNGPVEVAPSAAAAQPPVSLPAAEPIDIANVAKPKDTSEDGKYESGFI
jgi:hypothetical protein